MATISRCVMAGRTHHWWRGWLTLTRMSLGWRRRSARNASFTQKLPKRASRRWHPELDNLGRQAYKAAYQFPKIAINSYI
jgi:hypothetical protein